MVVNTVHGLYALPEDPWPKRAVVYGLERLAASCSHAELLQNPEDLPTLRRLRVPADRLAVLGNGIDLERFDPGTVSADDRAAARREMGATADDDVVVGLVGRLVREKGYPEVFEAAARLRTRFPHVRIAADRARRTGQGRRPHTHRPATRPSGRAFGSWARRNDVVRLYAGMDIHVLASHREGFPRSPMEASAMGVPVVATDVRGCRQAVDDGITGLLVPARDPEALAGAMARLASDPAERRRLGSAAAPQGAGLLRPAALHRPHPDHLRAPAGAGRSSAPPRPGAGCMTTLPRYVPGKSVTLPAVADLHAERIGEGFLVTLGPRFLHRLYRRIALSPDAVLLVADSGERVVGFVAAATSTRHLYGEFLRRDALPAGLAAAPAVLRAPRRVWETFRYGSAERGRPARCGDPVDRRCGWTLRARASVAPSWVPPKRS